MTAADTASTPPALQRTPLHALHLGLGARMVAFAGYEMPVSYPDGILAEHRHCRAAAALFDVSHMGQLRLTGAGADRALESLVPVDVAGLETGRQRYGFFTDASGGLLDDLMIARRRASHVAGSATNGAADGAAESELFLVVNAARKADDLAHLASRIGHRCGIRPLPGQALLALQGPQAVDALARLDAGVADLAFMGGGYFSLEGAECFVTRSGYTGEDGFEISVAADAAEALARTLLAQPEVKAAGLGARDTLRLEAGLCLYGHDIDTTTSPVEAGLAWAIQKVRRAGGARAGGYPGAAAIDAQLAAGPMKKRVGLVGLERMPVREGARLCDAHGRALGHVTSGTIGPTVGEPIAMAYLSADHALPHHEVWAEVRGRRVPMRVTKLPFLTPRYHRG
jgi:aminomethyltransferase